MFCECTIPLFNDIVIGEEEDVVHFLNVLCTCTDLPLDHPLRTLAPTIETCSTCDCCGFSFRRSNIGSSCLGKF